MGLKLLSKKQLTTNYIVIIMLVVALFGFADATFLTFKHYSGTALSCGVHGGCNAVTTSKYSTVFGIPVALGGSLFYLSIFIISIAYLDTKKGLLLKYLTWAPIAGLLASAWFVYLQLFVLHEICIYCMGSATTSTILFIMGMLILYRRKQKITKEFV